MSSAQKLPVVFEASDYTATLSVVNAGTSAPVLISGTIQVDFYRFAETAPFISSTIANGRLASVNASGGQIVFDIPAADLANIGPSLGTVTVRRIDLPQVLFSYNARFADANEALTSDFSSNVLIRVNDITLNLSPSSTGDVPTLLAISAHAAEADPHQPYMKRDRVASLGYHNGFPVTAAVVGVDGYVLEVTTRSGVHGFIGRSAAGDINNRASAGFFAGAPVHNVVAGRTKQILQARARGRHVSIVNNRVRSLPHLAGVNRRTANLSSGFSVSDDVLHIIIFCGQSNAEGNANSAIPANLAIVASTPQHAGYALMPSSGVRLKTRIGATDQYAPLVPAFSGLSDLVEAVDAGNGCYETAASGCVNQIISQVYASTGSKPKIAAMVAARGAYSASQLSRGQSTYNWVLRGVEDAAQAAIAMGLRPVVVALDWCQTETDATSGTTPGVYAASLSKIIMDINADIKALTGQAEDVRFTFTPAQHPQTSPAFNNVVLAHQMMSGHPLFLNAAPLYPLARTELDDGIHMSTTGQNRRGQTLGVVLAGSVFGAGFKAMFPDFVDVTSANDIRLRFPRPVVLDVSGDEVTTSGLASHGLAVLDSSGAAQAISSVAASGNDVTITLSGAVPGRAKVTYAQQATGTFGPVTGPRGTLRSNLTVASIYGGVSIKDWALPFIVKI